jgi:uncharacterized protein with PQ loop repeat
MTEGTIYLIGGIIQFLIFLPMLVIWLRNYKRRDINFTMSMLLVLLVGITLLLLYKEIDKWT